MRASDKVTGSLFIYIDLEERIPSRHPLRKNRSVVNADPPTHRNRNAEVDVRGERRSNAPHASMFGPEARLFKKSPGTDAVLCLMGRILMENRSGLIVQAELTRADGHAEQRAAIIMLHRHSPGSTRRLTLAADRG